MALKYKEHQQKSSTSDLEKQQLSKLSASEKIKNFIDESKKSQTLYASCEGSYNRRVCKVNDKASLEQFIHYTLFYCDKSFVEEEADEKRKSLISNVAEEMIKISKRLTIPNYVHYSMIWVHYYTYATSETNMTPLFKVYKSVHKEEAVFLDIFLNKYNNWEFYLENAVLPKAFLCAPRNGTYTFNNEEKSLDLIYVVSEEKQKKFLENAGHTFSPFYEKVLHPILRKVRSISEQVKMILSFIGSKLLEIWEDQEKFKMVLMLLLFGLEIAENYCQNSDAKILAFCTMFLREGLCSFDKGFALSESKNIRESTLNMLRLKEAKSSQNIQTLNKSAPLTALDFQKDTKDEVEVKAIRRLLAGLKETDEKPFEAIKEKVYEEAKSDNQNEFCEFNFPFGRDGPRKCFFFHRVTVPQLKKKFSLIFNDFIGNYSFRPKDDDTYDVIDNQGRVVAEFFCSADSSVLVQVIDDKA